MTSNELIALLGDLPVGRVRRNPQARVGPQGRLAFVYDTAWSGAEGAYPISLSMPLALQEHGPDKIEPFLWGLLPDNEMILERWARRFGVSARNAFALMTHVGEDCAGAVRFVTPNRLREIINEGSGTVDWLDEHDVAERLRALRRDASAWRTPTDTGQFSLAGAQPKTALLFDGKRWGVPSGRIPTTHILKPGTPELDGHAENEHFCLALAAELGLPVARSTVERFEDQTAIVVERFDRLATRSGIVRVHQEDVCQALAVHPASKYENEGGPGARAITNLLREHSQNAEEDVFTFIQSLIFNWLIGGTDAHAKNYSLLIGAEGGVRLAPLYDLASALPYAATQARKLKLAMKVGGKYRLYEISAHQWEKLAHELRFPADRIRTSLDQMTRSAADHVADVLRQERRHGLSHPILPKLAKALVARARQVAVR
jgi:serine/threonine-protein kinase HipA